MNNNTAKLLALAAAGIAIYAAVVTCRSVIAGMQALEIDEAARDGQAWIGVLLTVTELAAFSLAALLPSSAFWPRVSLVGVGAGALACSVLAMGAGMQAATERAGAAAGAQAERVTALRADIAARRAQADSLRATAEAQTRAVAITAARQGLARADELDGAAAQLQAELTQLQAQRRPTLAGLLGADGATLFALARSALIALVGVVMMGAAGALVRSTPSTESAPQAQHVTQPAPQPAPAESAPPEQAPAPVQDRVIYRAPSWIASMPVATLAAAPVAAVAAPAPAAPQEHQQEQEAAPPAAPDRYQRAVAAVASGAIKPTTRALQRHLDCGAGAACRLLQRMERDGIVQRTTAGGYEISEGEKT